MEGTCWDKEFAASGNASDVGRGMIWTSNSAHPDVAMVSHPTITRIARGYVSVLAALEVPLIGAIALLHLCVIMGVKQPSIEYGAWLFRVSVVLALPAAAFIRDSARWMDQVKSCPAWIWKTALGLALYSAAILLLQMIFSDDPSFSDHTLMMSGFPIGFNAMVVCIVYPVLRSNYLEDAELIRRVGASIAMVTVCALTLLAYQAGCLRHAKSY